MKITRTSPATGKVNSLDIEVTADQLRRWEGGEMIQNAMPNVSADEREFIKTGLTREDWDNMFGGAE